MTLYALVTGGVVQAVAGGPPDSARRLDTGQWVLGLSDAPQELRRACGWYEVVGTPRPADTATTTHDRSYEWDGVTVTETWTERPKTQDELDAETAEVKRLELDRAIAVNSAATELDALNALTPHVDGDPWSQPTGAHDAYRLAAIVTHAGKEWENLTDYNVWEPGVSGWRENAACPEWVQPTGAHDAYNTGDCVTYQGQTYVSLIDANTWAPDVYPAGWELQ